MWNSSRHKRAQLSTEFLALNGFLLLFFIAMLVVVEQRSVQIVQENLLHGEQAIGDVLRREVQWAFLAGPGYFRHFELPKSINGMNYSVTLQQNPGLAPELVVTYKAATGVQAVVVVLPQNTKDASALPACVANDVINTPWVRNVYGEVQLCMPDWTRWNV